MKMKPPRKVKNDIHKLLSDLDNDPKLLKQVVSDCMFFIQEMIELAHKYGHNEPHFAKLVLEAFQIEKLIKRGVIDVEHHKELLESQGVILSKTDLQLSCLLHYDFSKRILRNYYAHGNTDSIHTRISRLRSKIREQMILGHGLEEIEEDIEETEEVFDF